jgi:hypothetical protein
MALGPGGIDVLQTSPGKFVLMASLKDGGGNKVTSGTTTASIFEKQDDGSLKTYDFNDNTFKSGACTTPTVALSHQRGTNNTLSTGIWTAVLSTVSDFQTGGVYIVQVTNSAAMPADQERLHQWGGAEGDQQGLFGLIPAAL